MSCCKPLSVLCIIVVVQHVLHAHAQSLTNRSEPSPTPDVSAACSVFPTDDTHVYLYPNNIMTKYEFRMVNYTRDPLYTEISEYYKPWKWYKMKSEYGKTLLTLSFNYDVLSITILTIGIQTVHVSLRDEPQGCFGPLPPEEKIKILRIKVFDDLKESKTTPDQTDTKEEAVQSYNDEIYVCNEIIRNQGGYTDFTNMCCSRDDAGKITCADQEANTWITTLYVCITLVKVVMFLFSPFLLPSNLYTASYVAAEYVVKLQKDLRMKVFVSERQNDAISVKYRHRLTVDDFSTWSKFAASLEELPIEEIVHVKIPELRIKVKGKRIIPDNDPPTGLLRTLYDNLVRCKVHQLDPFSECCDLSVYGEKLQLKMKHLLTWHMFVKGLVRLLLLLMIPLPFYIRVYVYYHFEEDEINRRREITENLGLQQDYNLYRTNLIQHLSPTHPLFIACYCVYVVSGILIGFTNPCVRDTLMSIGRTSLQDMQNVDRTSVLQLVLKISLWPFRKCGLCAFVLAPVFGIVCFPTCTGIVVLYCVPTFYLSFRLLYHSWRKLSAGSGGVFGHANPTRRRVQRMQKLQKRLVSVDKQVHRRLKRIDALIDEKTLPCMFGYGRFFALRRLIIQLVVGVYFLTVMYATILLFVESVGLCVEVMAFTMMGIIVNAGSTLKFVSMALLVVVYMHNCYDGVYENYLTFNKTVIEEIMDRVSDLKKIASLPSSMQENAAFQVQPVEAVDVIPTSLNLKKAEPAWRIGHLLLFLDSNDTPRIPLNLFKEFCEIQIHGAPGPVYINLLQATAKFSVIVVFLFFVMIVVMAFGSVHQMSSTNQTLATLAGGFVPMLLKNVLSSRSKKLNLKTLSFKGQIDEIIAEFKQNWPIYDFVMEQYDPEEEKAKEEAEANTEDEGKEKEKDKDKEGNGTDGGKVEKDKKKDSVKDGNLGKTLEMLNINYKMERRGSVLNLVENSDDESDAGKGPGSSVSKDENFVDILIDLSAFVKEGSMESFQSYTMMNEVEKRKTKANKNGIEMPYSPDYAGSTEFINIPSITVDNTK